MERPGALIGLLFSVAILAGSAFPTPLASTTEISWSDKRLPFKSQTHSEGHPEDHPDCPWLTAGHTEDTARPEEPTKDSSRLKERSLEDAPRSKPGPEDRKDDRKEDRKGDRKGDRKDDVSGLNRQRGPPADLSHDILPNLAQLPARAARRAEGGARDEKNGALPVKVTFGNDVERRSIDSYRRDTNFGPTQDRYRPLFRRPYPSQRYRASDMRDPYRKYLRYPVFPGR